MAVAKELGGYEKEFCGVEGFAGAHQPFITTVGGHIMRGQKDRVVVGFIEMAVGAVDDVRLGQDGTAFGMELMDHEVVDLGWVGTGSGWSGFLRWLRSCGLREGQ